jgi:hypothetical protein
MNRQQTLHHFELACGVLPEDESDTPVIAEETPASPFFERPFTDGDEVDLLPATDGELIAQNDVPPAPSTEGSAPSFPSPGGPAVITPSFTGPPGSNTPVPPPAVPEPSSYVLVLTGLAGAAGEIRRRFKSKLDLE